LPFRLLGGPSHCLDPLGLPACDRLRFNGDALGLGLLGGDALLLGPLGGGLLLGVPRSFGALCLFGWGRLGEALGFLGCGLRGGGALGRDAIGFGLLGREPVGFSALGGQAGALGHLGLVALLLESSALGRLGLDPGLLGLVDLRLEHTGEEVGGRLAAVDLEVPAIVDDVLDRLCVPELGVVLVDRDLQVAAEELLRLGVGSRGLGGKLLLRRLVGQFLDRRLGSLRGLVGLLLLLLDLPATSPQPAGRTTRTSRGRRDRLGLLRLLRLRALLCDRLGALSRGLGERSGVRRDRLHRAGGLELLEVLGPGGDTWGLVGEQVIGGRVDPGRLSLGQRGLGRCSGLVVRRLLARRTAASTTSEQSASRCFLGLAGRGLGLFLVDGEAQERQGVLRAGGGGRIRVLDSLFLDLFEALGRDLERVDELGVLRSADGRVDELVRGSGARTAATCHDPTPSCFRCLGNDAYLHPEGSHVCFPIAGVRNELSHSGHR
jgi:hypothetical protein